MLQFHLLQDIEQLEGVSNVCFWMVCVHYVTTNPGSICTMQVQDADSYPHTHQRETTSLPYLPQEFLPPREPEDTHPLTHR